jgi:drug/metabolite transporter (DMT)-like permease
MTKKFKGTLLGLLLSGTFGLIPFFSIPLMKAGMGIPTILFYQFLFAVIIMTPIYLWKKQKAKVSPDKFVVLLLSICYAATSLGLIWSYSYISSGVSTTIHFLYPILVAAIMLFLNKKRDKNRVEKKQSPWILLYAALSFIGVALLSWNNGDTIKMTGVIIALFTIVTYAFYMVGLEEFVDKKKDKQVDKKVDKSIVTFYILFLGMLFFGLYAILSGGVEPINTYSEWSNLIILALVPTVAADYFLIVIADSNWVGSTISSILGVMEPVVAVCMGVLFFAEQFNIYSLIGLALVLFSVAMVIIYYTPQSQIKDN